MATTFSQHLLGPDTHANRPAADAVPAGTLYSCSEHDLIYKTDGSAWSTWATVGGTDLSDVDPQALGQADSGTGTDAARDDHVHPATIAANEQTADYTLALSDAGKAVEMNVGSANNLTVPAEASVDFPVGTVIEVCQTGSGQTTIVEATDVTVNTPETLALSGQWSTVSLRKRGTDLWVLAGDVEAA